MTRTISNLDNRKIRVLVVIASFGKKNIEFLKTVISKYQSLAMAVDIIVLSEGPKDLGRDVKVVVGLPSKNPWSLPFGHKRIFAENVNRYDLFAYSEDDIEITNRHLESFLRITPTLEHDEIAGYLLYEIKADGTHLLPNVHGPFHWISGSVRRRGDYTVAQFSNEHSASYLLTRQQLKRAIASGGFLRDPYEGKYDMLCAAATDPYTSCGFHKVICISHLEDFLLHHLPDRYSGKFSVSLAECKQQVQTLLAIGQGKHVATALFEIEPRAFGVRWAKSYYEEPDQDFLALIPSQAKDILCVGSGWGATEAHLKRRGLKVTALPLDSVIGALAARRGIEVIYGTFAEALEELQGRRFDCVILTDLLHLMRDPAVFLAKCMHLLRDECALLLSGPNFDYFPILARRFLKSGDYLKLQTFQLSGINVFSIVQLQQWLRDLGFHPDVISWKNPEEATSLSGSMQAPSWWRRVARRVWYRLVSIALGKDERIKNKLVDLPNERIDLRRFVAQTWVLRARQLSSAHPQVLHGNLTESPTQRFATSSILYVSQANAGDESNNFRES